MGATYSEFARTCENYDKQGFTSSRNPRSHVRDPASPPTPRAQVVSPFRQGRFSTQGWFRGTRAEEGSQNSSQDSWFRGSPTPATQEQTPGIDPGIALELDQDSVPVLEEEHEECGIATSLRPEYH